MDFDPIAVIDADSVGLAEAADGNFDAAVDACPGWSVRDLVRHILGVQFFWGQIVADSLADPDLTVDPDDPPDDRLVAEFRSGAARFVDILRDANPATPVWTWSTQHDVAFIVRHQVQETAVHRWDAEHAAGRPFSIQTAAAVDSIDEFLTFSTQPADPAAERLGDAVALVATDASTAWTLTDETGAIRWARGIMHPAAELHATASDLLLWLYRRITAADLSVLGDPAQLDRFAAYTSTG